MSNKMLKGNKPLAFVNACQHCSLRWSHSALPYEVLRLVVIQHWIIGEPRALGLVHDMAQVTKEKSASVDA